MIVAEELHFGRAAQRLNIVQPAVSQQVSRLERELGLRLLDRSSRSVRLTDDGRHILQQARRVLAAATETTALAAELSRRQLDVIRVGAGSGLERRVERGLGVLRAGNPALTVRFADGPVASQLDALRVGELDLALVRGVRRAPGLQVTPAWAEEVVSALPATHPLAGRDAVRLGELAGFPVRLPPPRCDDAFRDLVLAACREAGFEPVPGQPAGALERTLLEVANGRDEWAAVPAAPVGPSGLRTVRFDPPLRVTGAVVTTTRMGPDCRNTLAAAFGDTAVDYGGRR